MTRFYQVSIVEPGAFRTLAMQSAPRFPIPEVYLTPTSGIAKVQKIFGHFESPETKFGDPQKFAEKIWQLLALSDPPLRLPLGQDAVEFVEDQLKIVSADVEKYKSWSSDVIEQ